jgi:hypothetical protein
MTPSEDDFDDAYGDHGPQGPDAWPDATTIDPSTLPHELRRLTMLGDDPFLSMQATNLGLVDAFLNQLESQLMRSVVTEDGTPISTAFVSAQSQMWIFAAYELLRTWKQRVKDTQKLIKNGGLEARLAKLEKPLSYQHPTRDIRANQLRRVVAVPNVLDVLDADLRRIHVTFGLMEALRMALAKHEEPKQVNSVAFAPGYGRINIWNGAIDFELSVGRNILGTTSHRELAEGFRHMWDDAPQTWEELAGFDAFLKGSPEGDLDLAFGEVV